MKPPRRTAWVLPLAVTWFEVLGRFRLEMSNWAAVINRFKPATRFTRSRLPKAPRTFDNMIRPVTGQPYNLVHGRVSAYLSLFCPLRPPAVAGHEQEIANPRRIDKVGDRRGLGWQDGILLYSSLSRGTRRRLRAAPVRLRMRPADQTLPRRICASRHSLLFPLSSLPFNPRP